MEFILGLRQATKTVLQKFERIWLEEFPVAWNRVYGQSHAQLQAAALQAGFKDYVDLLRNCSTFCQFETLPEQAQRPLVRYIDPTSKVEVLAFQLRDEACQRFEHVSLSEVLHEISHRFNVNSFEELDVPISTVPTLQQLTDLEAKVFNYLSAYIGIRHTVTLYDLEQHLCSMLRVREFDELHLGPLLKNPAVQQHFQPPPEIQDIPKVSLSDVINAVERLLTPKNPQVQTHAILQYLTREFEYSMPQDLCVRIDSPESLVQLVRQIQQEERNARNQVRELKIHEAIKEEEKIPVTKSDLSLAALRDMNNADAPNAPSAVRHFVANPPSPSRLSTFLDDPKKTKNNATDRAGRRDSDKASTASPSASDEKALHWAALETLLDETCSRLVKDCSYTPSAFSLSMLAEAFSNCGKMTQQAQKKTSKWAAFWQQDVLAGLLLRAKAESLYQSPPINHVPQPVAGSLSDAASHRWAAALHLQPKEVTWAVVYVHFLDQTKSFLQTHKADPVNVFALGQHLSRLLPPDSNNSQEAGGVPSQGGSPGVDPNSQALQSFWTHDVLAAYLLSSLVRLLGRQPVYPDVPEATFETSNSAMVRHNDAATAVQGSPVSPETAVTDVSPAPSPKTGPRSPSLKAQFSPCIALVTDAESRQPHDSGWLLTQASAALQSLSSELLKHHEESSAAAMAAVERMAVDLQYQNPDTFRFLAEFANIGVAAGGAARLAQIGSDTQEQNEPSQPPSTASPAAGQGFRPVPLQQLHAAVAELCKGSSPRQLALLEQAVQGHFQAPSFAALGHGPSLLQLVGQDETMARILGSAVQVGASRQQVLSVVQQAMQAAASDAGDGGQAASITNIAEACLQAHFRVPAAEALGHGTVPQLIKLSQQQPQTAQPSVLSAAALAAAKTSLVSGSLYTGSTSPLVAAKQALARAPVLSDLATWTSWELLFEQELGPLPEFVQQTGVVKALQLPSQVLLRLPEHSSLESFASALSQGSVTDAVSAVLGVVAEHQGVLHAPLAMLASHCKAHLAMLHSSIEASALAEGRSKGPDLSKAAMFVLQCLEMLPQPLLPALAQPLLLQPLNEVAQSPAFAEQSLLKAAAGQSQRAVLQSLGFMLGVTAWQEDWHSMMCPAAAKPPLHPQSAFASPAPAADSPSLSDQADIQAVLSQLLSQPGSQTAADSSTDRSEDPQPVSHDSLSLMQKAKSNTQNLAVGIGQSTPAGASPPAVIDLVDSEEEEAEEAQRCQAVVERIRQEEFGVGVKLDAAGSQLRQRQNERIGRALQRLSQELYSKDTHFVLELVQNADDNVYAAGVLPALEFVLQESGIAVLNNEVGFRDENIRALCDVGRTTKQRTLGYIGQKGIGFKSVFKITDAPQIHSGGFHVVFDLLRHSALGYVLPTWLEESPMQHISNSKLASRSTATKMVLPFKQASQQSFSTLRRRFDDVQPTLLLFLQRLQCIIINDTVSGEASIMIRRPLGGGVVELRHGPQAEHVTCYLQVSHSQQPSVPRLDVRLDQTTVSLAFNLQDELPGQQQVYAFLPLRSYGLTFIVQADFIVPSSREAVDCDSAWNEALREQLPNLFLQALQSFRQLAPPSPQLPLFWVNRWLQSIPLPREAQSFFAALPQRIAARLQQAPCIPTEAKQWVYPNQALVCQNPQVRTLLGDPRLAGVMSLQYAHSGLTVLHSSSPLQKLLGLGQVAHGHLMDVVRQLHSQGETPGGMLAHMGSTWLAQLLLCVFDSLAQDQAGVVGYESSSSAVATATGKAVVKELRQLFPIMLADGKFAAVDSSEPTYFPMELAIAQGRGAEEGASGLTGKQQKLLRRCELPLRVVDASFLEAAGPDKQPALMQALQTLGVKHMQLPGLITQHMLPALVTCTESAHVAFLGLIISSGLTASEAPDQGLAASIVSSLKSHGKVVTNHGVIPLQGSFLHLPPALDNKIDLANLFPKLTWHFPSTEYLATGAGNASAWRALFMALGFTDFIQTHPCSLVLTPQQVSESIWAKDNLGLPNRDGNFSLQDWSATEFLQVLESLAGQETDPEARLAQHGHLVHQLDVLWEEQYARCCTAYTRQTESGSAQGPKAASQQLPSSFLHALRHTAWLPTTSGTLQLPGTLFLPDRQTISLLGDHVPYLRSTIKDPSLLQALGVTLEVSWQDVLCLLITWAKAPVFKTSLEQMSNVYSFLGDALESDAEAAQAICKAFEQHPLVWLPSSEASERSMHSVHSIRSIRSMLSSAASEAGTPFRGPALVPYEITPTPISTMRRSKSRRKASFMTPGAQARRFGTPAPAHTPYTPAWAPQPSPQQVEGHFYAATGSKLRLFDSSGVIGGIPQDKLGIRILSEHYTSQAVMQFFGQNLVASSALAAASPAVSTASSAACAASPPVPAVSLGPDVKAKPGSSRQTLPDAQEAQLPAQQQTQPPPQVPPQQQPQHQSMTVLHQQQQLQSSLLPGHQQSLPQQHASQHTQQPLQQQANAQQRQQQQGQGEDRTPVDRLLQRALQAPQARPAQVAPMQRADAYIDLVSESEAGSDMEISPQKPTPAAVSHQKAADPAGPARPLKAEPPLTKEQARAEAQNPQGPASLLAVAAVQPGVANVPCLDGQQSNEAPHAQSAADALQASASTNAAQSLYANAQNPHADAQNPQADAQNPHVDAQNPLGDAQSPHDEPMQAQDGNAQGSPGAALEPQLLIQLEPSCQEYCQALAIVAVPVPPAYHSVQLSKVLAILNRWSGLIAEAHMGAEEVEELRQRLQRIRAFPVAGQQWASLADGLMLNDEPALARLFEQTPGVVLLHLPAVPHRSDRASADLELGPLLTALEVPALSRAVQQSVPQVQGFSGSVELDPIIADCILAVQRYLFHSQPETYKALDQTVMSRLLNLRCVIVTELRVVYRLATAAGVTVSQPQQQPAALQGSDLYVEVDRLDSYTHILPELTRLFAGGARDPDMAQFLIALTLTMMSRQDAEAFMQQEGCPALPVDVPEWQTPHLARALDQDADLSEDGELAAEDSNLFLVRNKRDLSPSGAHSADEPDSKKQKREAGLSSPQPQHYTPLLDPSSRRVDYLDLATPRTASHPSTLKRPRRTAPLDEDGQPAAVPLQRAGSAGTPLPEPGELQNGLPRLLFEAKQAQHAPHVPAQAVPGGSVAARPAAQQAAGQQALTRLGKRPRSAAEGNEGRRRPASGKAGSSKRWTVSSIQDLFDALYPYKGKPWALQDVGVRAPADWHTIAALAIRAPQHLPMQIRDQARPVLEGPAPKVDQADLNQQTGRWGEELVFAYLQWQLAAYSSCVGTYCDRAFVCQSTGWLVEWINYREETRRPFDILIRDPQMVEIFVEVKASAIRGRNIFQFSLQELKFAESHGNKLHVYRVAGIGSSSPTLTRLINPVQLSKLKLINLCLQM